MRLTKTLAYISLYTAGFLLLTGCSNPSSNTEEQANPTPSVSASEYSQTGEIVYMQDMIPHHQQAITMAQYAILNSTSQEVLDLATHIMETQDDEIQLMRQLIQERGGNPNGTGTKTNSAEETTETPESMLTEEELQQLKQTTREEFDTLFLEQMIKHHQKTISMSSNILSQSADDPIRRLAQSITREQEQEIQLMQRLLNDRGITTQVFP